MRHGKRSVIKNFTGSVAVDPVVIRPPVVARNKGRGKRLKGGREIAVTMKKPGERTCATCGLANGHDSRNCVLRKMNQEYEGSVEPCDLVTAVTVACGCGTSLDNCVNIGICGWTRS
nr:protein FAR1-RELATED SEQUENCE 5-like [Ipomoea batatas]GME12440.1 protein FAR1-RELATED SEQUENCE 5-like [Ipomoea batatas]